MSSDEDINLPSLSASSEDDDDISLPSAFSPYDWSSDDSDGSMAKNRKVLRLGGYRTWLVADELALLEAIAAHKEQHGCLPSPAVLVAALRGRLEVTADQVARRVHVLRRRLYRVTKKLSSGRIPVKDNDLKILRLSRRIWKTERNLRKPRVNVRHERREFAELAALYPSLAAEVEERDGVLKTAFEFIGDMEATELEAKIKEQKLLELKVSMKASDLTMKVTTQLLKYIDS